jgi:hypothetical protein
VRLYDRDADAGLATLIGLRERRTTLEAVRTRLKETPASDLRNRFRVMTDRAKTIERCEDAFGEAAPRLFGEGAVAKRRPALRYFRRLGFDVPDSSRNILAGADLHLAEPPERGGYALETIAQSVALSLYLPAFYIVFGPGNGDDIITRAGQILDVLKTPWIGMLSIRDDGWVEGVREVRGVPPGGRNAADYAAIVEAFGGRRSGEHPIRK